MGYTLYRDSVSRCKGTHFFSFGQNIFRRNDFEVQLRAKKNEKAPFKIEPLD